MAKNGIQRNLFVYFLEFNNSPLIKRYEVLFKQIDLSFINPYNTGKGATGYSRHALIRALIFQKLENIHSISALCRHLRDHPIVADICGFDPNEIPDETVFYRFLKHTNNSLFHKIHRSINNDLIEKGIISTEIVAIDSKPIQSNTKENNIKNPNRNVNNKHLKPKADPYAALGFYSSSNEYNNQKKTYFFWGYRNHAIIDAKTGICLVEVTLPANQKDEIVATELMKMLKKQYKAKNKIIVIGDKAYDTNQIFSFIIHNLRGIPIIPENRRNKKQRISDKQGRPLCQAGIPMIYNGKFSDNKRTRAKFRCPIICARKSAKLYNTTCPINSPKFCEGKKYGCTAYITITENDRTSTDRYSQSFRKLYKRRQTIEIYFSRLKALEIEIPIFFNQKSIANSTTITHIALSAVAAAACQLKKPHKIRAYKTYHT